MDTKETKMVNILNEMSYPTYKDHHGNFKHYGCAQGYYGHTISLFLILMRDQRDYRNIERQYGRTVITNTNSRLVGVRSSTIHWRKLAEEHLKKRLHKFMIQIR